MIFSIKKVRPDWTYGRDQKSAFLQLHYQHLALAVAILVGEPDADGCRAATGRVRVGDSVMLVMDSVRGFSI